MKYINIFLSRQVKVDGRVNRNGTDSINITESGMSVRILVFSYCTI